MLVITRGCCLSFGPGHRNVSLRFSRQTISAINFYASDVDVFQEGHQETQIALEPLNDYELNQEIELGPTFQSFKFLNTTQVFFHIVNGIWRVFTQPL